MDKQFSLKDKPSGRGYVRHYSEERIKSLFMLTKTADDESVPEILGRLEVNSKFDCDKITMPSSFIGMEVVRLK
jgi:hypothetical protein